MSSSQKHKGQLCPGWLVGVKLATDDSRRRDKHASADLGRIRHAWSASHVSRRSVAGFAFMTSFRQDRCDSFSARDPQAGSGLCPRVRHRFGATRSRLVLFQEKKGSQSPRLTAHALHGDVERPRCAVGSGVTLHVAAFFPRWRDGVRCGQCSTSP